MDVLLENYARDGFVLIEGLLDAEQTERAKRSIEWMMALPPENYKWVRQNTSRWFREHPILAELMEHVLVIDFARGWLGPDFHVIAAQCSRSIRDDHYALGAMALHQDEVFFPAPECRAAGVADERYGFSAMWYVQDTSLEMGPTELLAGSHRTGEDHREIDSAKLFRRPIPAGSLLIFSHRTWHRGALNETETPRDLITNAYARPEIEKVQLLSRLADGSSAYVPDMELLASSDEIIVQLLADRATDSSGGHEPI